MLIRFWTPDGKRIVFKGSGTACSGSRLTAAAAAESADQQRASRKQCSGFMVAGRAGVGVPGDQSQNGL